MNQNLERLIKSLESKEETVKYSCMEGYGLGFKEGFTRGCVLVFLLMIIILILIMVSK